MSEEELLQKIRLDKANREIAIRALYTNPQLRIGLSKVLQMSVDSMEFNDIFNLTLVQFMKTVIKNKSFRIKTNIHSYLFVIAKHIQIAKYKKQKLKTTDFNDLYSDLESDIPTMDLIIIEEENKKYLKEIINQLGRNCYEILWNWASGYSMKEIAEKLSYNTEEVVRRKKYLCLKRISAFLDENPSIKNLFR